MPIDLTKYTLLADVWDGSGQIDEGLFLAGGVKGMLVRMNNSWGGLQYDANFLMQWKEAAGFRRAAYVVVSPLNVGHVFTSKEIVDWILAWKPVDCTRVALDVEIDARVLYSNATITPKYYSDFLLGIFAGLHAAGITCIQYSGAWFYAMVQPWVKPDYVFQWWARYPINPPIPVDAYGHKIFPTITWAGLKTKLAALDWIPLITGYTEAMTGKISLWQFASVFVLPGCPPNQPVDLNVMLNDDFYRMFGAPVIPPTGLLTDAQVIARLVSDWRAVNPNQ